MKVILSVSAVIVALGIVGGSVYFWTHQPPPPKTDDELKSILPTEATQFLKCIEATKIGACFATMTTEAYRTNTGLEKMTEISHTIKEKLGDRISGAMNPDSFKTNITSDQPPIRTAEFSMSAIYQNDATTRESFVFVYDSTSDQYKIHTFKINSSKF